MHETSLGPSAALGASAKSVAMMVDILVTPVPARLGTCIDGTDREAVPKVAVG